MNETMNVVYDVWNAVNVSAAGCACTVRVDSTTYVAGRLTVIIVIKDEEAVKQ